MSAAKRWRAITALGLTLLFSAPAIGTSRPLDPKPAHAWASLQQHELPALDARRQIAAARSAGAERWFAGEIDLDEAFPRLAGQPLASPALLAGRLQVLEQRAREREAERQAAPPPDLGAGRRAKDWRRLVDKALAAEEQADTLERRALHGFEVLIAARPELAEGSLRAQLTDFDQRIVAAEDAWRVAQERADDGDADRSVELAWLQADRARLVAVIAALRRQALTAAQGLLDPSSELAILADMGSAGRHRDALLRLRAMADAGDPGLSAALAVGMEPWLSAALSRAERSRDATAAALSAAQVDTTGDPGAIVLARAAARSRADRAERAARWIPPATLGALAERWARLLQLEAENSAAELALAEQRARRANEASEAAAMQAAEELRKARAAEEEARSKAENLLAAATAQQDIAAAEASRYLERFVADQARSTELWDATRQAQEQLGVLLDDPATRLGSLEDRHVALLGLLPGSGGRRAGATAAYTELRALLTELRRAGVDVARLARAAAGEQEELEHRLRGDGDGISAASALASSLEVGAVRAALEDAIPRWKDARDRQERALAVRVAESRAARGRTFDLLDRGHELRGALGELVPSAVRNEDRAVLLSDLGLELDLLLPNLVNLVQRRWDFTRSLPERRGMFRLAWTGLVSGFWLLVLLVAWWLLSERADFFSRLILARVARGFGPLYQADLMGLRGQMSPVVRAALALVALRLLAGSLDDAFPEIALVLFGLGQIALFRLLRGLFVVCTEKQPSIRPAFFTFHPQSHQLASTAWGVLTFCFVVRSFVVHLAADLLGADALEEVLLLLLDLGAAAVTIVLLHRLEPITRRLLGRNEPRHPILRWLAVEQPRLILLSWLRALLGALLLLSAWLITQLQLRTEEASLGGRLVNRFTLYRLGRLGEQAPNRAIDPALRRSLIEHTTKPGREVARPGLDDALQEALDDWMREGRRGLVVLVGDRGSGKRTWLDATAPDLRGGSLKVRRLRLDRRVHSEQELCCWLSQTLGLPRCEDRDGLRGALSELEPSLLIVEEVHLAFLRAVGGFAPLEALLEVVGETGERHFWLLSMHRPAWQYVSRLGDLLKLDVRRAVLEMPPMGESQLRELMTRRAKALGYQLDWSRIGRTSILVGDRRAEQERARTAFFRLLAEASEGNPSAALRQFARSLSPHPTEEGLLQPQVTDALERRLAEKLATTDLFTLAALRIHRRLSPEELGRVNNMAGGLVRASVRHLENRGLIQWNGERLEIPLDRVPEVGRSLKRSHFLHWSD